MAGKTTDDALKKFVESQQEKFSGLGRLCSIVPDMVCIACVDGYFKFLNQEWEKTLGYSLEELLSRTLFDFIHPDDREPTRKEIERQLKGNMTLNFENRYRCKNGSYKILEWRCSPAEGDMIYAVARDITKRVQAEEDLATQKRRLAYILRGTNAGTWEWNVRTGETTFNERWAGIIGYTLEEISPISVNTWRKVVHPDDLKVSDELLEKHFNHELDYYECEARMRHKNGDWVWVLARGKVVTWTEDGKALLMSGTHLDITNRKRAEERIAASLKEKEVLLREIHHRVKNNMQVIVSLMRMHARQSRNKWIRNIFDDCRDRVNAMSLVHEALYQSEDLAQINFEVYLKKLCRNLSQAHGATSKGIAVTVERCNVELDIDQGIAVGMVISELVSNAFKHAFPFGKGGSVSLSLSGLEGEEVELIVEDNGKGLPPEIDILNLPSLGLQLAVAAVTRELGGSIEVERDGGTRFAVRFKARTHRKRKT